MGKYKVNFETADVMFITGVSQGKVKGSRRVKVSETNMRLNYCLG